MTVQTATKIAAEARSATGKGAARALRRAGKIPAIVYGAGMEPLKVALSLHDFKGIYQRAGFLSHLVELDMGKETLRVLPRAVELHPVTDVPEHADFLRVTKDSKVRVMVRVLFKNKEKSIGLKRGGTLNIVRRELDLICRQDSIPEVIEIDLEQRNIGQSIHISHIALPDGVESAITDRDFTIATIVGRRGEKDTEDKAAAGAEAAATPAAAAAPAAAKAGDAKKPAADAKKK